jgi:hypothetical protein
VSLYFDLKQVTNSYEAEGKNNTLLFIINNILVYKPSQPVRNRNTII